MDRNISAAELPDLLFHYEFVEKVGEGGNSEVWSIKAKDGLLYATKIPDSPGPDLYEASTMSHLAKHPNSSPFLTFYGVYNYDGKIAIVNELFVGNSIRELPTDSLDEEPLTEIVTSIFSQLDYLHERGLNHGDVHSGNLLYNSQRVVFIDITPQVYDDKINPKIWAEIVRTTLPFWNKAISDGMTPAIIMTTKDIFDAGMIVRSLITGLPQPTYRDFVVNPRLYEITSEYPELDKLVNSCINLDLTERPSAVDILKYLGAY